MTSISDAAAEFLSYERVAVTGVSRSPDSHANNVVYRRLRERGYDVFAVNPNADSVEGGPADHDLSSIPGGVEAVVIGTRPDCTAAGDHPLARAADRRFGSSVGGRRTEFQPFAGRVPK